VSRDRAVDVCRFYVRKRSILIERRDERTRARNSRFEKAEAAPATHGAYIPMEFRVRDVGLKSSECTYL